MYFYLLATNTWRAKQKILPKKVLKEFPGGLVVKESGVVAGMVEVEAVARVQKSLAQELLCAVGVAIKKTF